MAFVQRVLLCLVVLSAVGRAYAQTDFCNQGDERDCVVNGCPGVEVCDFVGDDPRYQYLSWTECQPSAGTYYYSCSACGEGGVETCTDGHRSRCEPAHILSHEVCGNDCDENGDGLKPSCSGQQNFDYCQSNGNGSYTRWRCGCEEGAQVGYCLGSNDPQDLCSSPTGCLKAPAFGSGGASQLGGNFACCVVNQPCSSEGFVMEPGVFQCGTGFGRRYECTPGTSCQDSNQCGDRCQGVKPTIDSSMGTWSGAGASCRPANYSQACTQAQGGLSGRASGGVGALETPNSNNPEFYEDIYVVGTPPPVSDSLPVPGVSLLVGRGGGGSDSAPVGGGGGGGSSSTGAPAVGPSPAPLSNVCGEGVVGGALSAMSMPSASLTDMTTRFTQADVGIKGTLGGFNFVRKYVSTDNTWAYMSLVGNDGEDFLPKPFGASPWNKNSLLWWHGLYSFVYPKGWVPGVSTWAVRDVNGAVHEYEACSSGDTACFAKPRETSRWSTAQLYWTGGGTGSGHFEMVVPGMGRYVYASEWRPPSGGQWRRFFLTRVEDDVYTSSGTPRVRLTLSYQMPYVNCPGASALGNGVPYLREVKTEDGSTLWLGYSLKHTLHDVGASHRECVITGLFLRDNPNAGSSSMTQVAGYQYFELGDGYDYAGQLVEVDYPETGDIVSYVSSSASPGLTSSTATEQWSVSVNGSQVASHEYTNGKVTSLSTAGGGAMAFSGSPDCGVAQVSSAECQPTTAAPPPKSAGDSAGSTVQVSREYLASLMEYLPYKHVTGFTDRCVSGTCEGVAQGLTYSSVKDAPGGFLLPSVEQSKKGWANVYSHVLAEDAAASSLLPQPVLEETRKYGVSGSLSGPGVYTEKTRYEYGVVVPTMPVEPFKPVVSEKDSRASVLMAGEQTYTTTTYDGATHRLKSVIREGYTQHFDAVTGAWGGPQKQYVGTFYFNHHKCLGETDNGRTEVSEVHGPCVVDGSAAADCSGTDFPITQYHYYPGPEVELSNRANRLQKVSVFAAHGGPDACTGYTSLDTTFDSYDSRGNATRITNPQGVVASYVYKGGRVVTSSVGEGADALVTRFIYDGSVLKATQLPTGNHVVRCYRTGTTPGQGCVGGQMTDKLRWVAVAEDEAGADWSEKTVLTYFVHTWDGKTAEGELKTEEFWSRRDGSEELRRKIEHHPDAHGRPTYSRWGEGQGSFAAVASFDKNGNLAAMGQPFNAAPDYCKDSSSTTIQPLSQLCTVLEYDTADRLTRVSAYPSAGTAQHTKLMYDIHGNVQRVQVGCADPNSCTQPESVYTYDDFGNLLRVQLPHAEGPVRYGYDARGNLTVKQTEAMRAAGEWLAYEYDALSRPKMAIRRVSGDTSISEPLYVLGYDEEEVPHSSCVLDSNLRSKSQLRFREDSFGRTWYQYDVKGRLVGELRMRQGGTQCNPALTTRYVYDSQGRLAEVVYPYQRSVTYEYGEGANEHRVQALQVLIFGDEGSSSKQQLVSNVTWEPFGGLRGYQLNHPGGSSRAVEYALGDNGTIAPTDCAVGYPSAESSDRTGRLRSLRVSSGGFTPGGGNGDIYKRTYTWKADQVARVDTCLLGGAQGSVPPQTEVYGYDRTLRLTEATNAAVATTGGTFKRRTYGYDLRGNRNLLIEDDFTSRLTRVAGSADMLDAVTSEVDDRHVSSFSYDADGRVVRKEAGRYMSGEAASTLEMQYGAALASGGTSGSARETVFRAVTVNNATYSYYYDALGRRRAKVYPSGVRDEYFHAADNTLLVDQGSDSAIVTSFRPVDDYVWLGGRPVVVVRGRLQSDSDERLSDATADCQRNGEAATCGAYFPVTDHIGKPVLMLDGAGRVAGVGEYDPFGRVNRVVHHGGTAHPVPYPEAWSSTLATFSQPVRTGTHLRMRVIFQLVDLEEGEDSVRVLDSTGGELWSQSGERSGAVTTPWLAPVEGPLLVDAMGSPKPSMPEPYESDYTGAVLDGCEYQRYEEDARPFWTPLGFPGQYYDSETDLLENWNRYYDPSTGRYLQPEPLLAATSVALPVYAYAMNNPVGVVDPTGFVPGYIFRGGTLEQLRNRAAIDALLYIHPSSEFHIAEYGGMICRRSDGGVFATEPVCGGKGEYQVRSGDSPCPEGTTTVGVYHTHPAGGSDDMKNRYAPFSDDDLTVEYPAYLSRENGTSVTDVWRWDYYMFNINGGRTRIFP